MEKNGVRQLSVEYIYGGQRFHGFPEQSFHLSETKEEQTDNRITALYTFSMINEPLEICIKTTKYPKYDVDEWTILFSNNSQEKSKVIESIAACISFSGDNPVLKGILGDHQNEYSPYSKKLTDGPVKFCSDNGRPTHIFFPYFNLEHGNKGAMLSIGWGGTWEAVFQAEPQGASCRLSGNNGLRTYLLPGEKIRTPMFTVLRYDGRDEDMAANKWRRWYIDCSMPRQNKDGGPVRPFSTTWLASDTGLPNSDGSISERYFTWKPSMEKMLSEGYKPSFRWMDAGWYLDPAGKSVPEDWWGTVGTWELDKEKWPDDTFLQSTDYARNHGMKTLLWFEPERVTHIDDLAKNYGYDPSWAIGGFGNSSVNDIGKPDCYAWTLRCIKKALGDHRVEMYREDNNFDVRPCWIQADITQGPDRDGITENKAVCAHYKMWDEIIAFTSSNGGCAFCDSCASGGGRNDLESLRRGIPLLRSDADRTATALRLSMSSTFLKWIPFCGASCTEQANQLDPDGKRDKYIFRASYLPILNLNAQWTQDPNTDFDLIRWGFNEWQKVNRYLLEDFYVLSPWHGKDDKRGWTAFEYFDPKKEEGILLLFRMEEANDNTQTFCLKGLCKDKNYIISDADSGQEEIFTGAVLTEGYMAYAPRKRTALLKYIRKTNTF